MQSSSDGLVALPDHPGYREPEPFADAEHPMRKVTRQVAFEQGWSGGRARKVAELFDEMAPGWHTDHVDPVRQASIIDAVERGGLNRSGQWLELGAGTGSGTMVLAPAVDRLVMVDLSFGMLSNARADLAPRVQGDASRLPFSDDRFDGIMMVNMLLFPEEVDRVLAPGGRLVWVNTLGENTPIHLPPDDLLAALPGEWTGSTARAGTGFWVSITRRGEG